MKSFQPERLVASVIPPVTETTVAITQRFMGEFPLTAGGSVPTFRGFAMADLVGLVPGGTSFWNRARVERVQVWLKPSLVGVADAVRQQELQIQIPGDATTGSPPVTFRDSSVDGLTLPTVAWKYGLAQRMRWVSPANTDNLFTITLPNSTTGGTAFVVATLALVSPQLAA